MGCNKPMIIAQTYETYKTVTGKIAYKQKFIKEGDIRYKDILANKKLIEKGNWRKIDIVPCGKCIGCRLNYARDKAIQCSLEKLNPIYTNDECWFLTLTYDDTKLVTHTTINEETGEKIEGVTIKPEHMQNFWKRIREHYPQKKIQYLNVGEYGKEKYRPHYHAIVFGIKIDESLLIRVGNNIRGDPIYECPELELIWQQGKVWIGEVTFRSISYVARYTLKKTKSNIDDWWYQSQGKLKEWQSMSQSMGRWYYEENKHKIYETDTVPVLDNNGNICKPPKSYDRLYKKEFPEKWEKIAAKRKEEALAAIYSEEQQTNIYGYKYKAVKEENLKEFIDLRGEGKYGT